ncbi:MAG: radical SAM protein [Candidatus Omnitrophica bacterium]|nr:radical SAM protein [Candidatus Omnitrophota bacterium]
MLKSFYRFIYRHVDSHSPVHNAARKIIFAAMNFKYRALKLHVNNSCNLKCKTCYCHFEGKGNILTREEIFRLIDQLKIFGHNLDLHILGGEPLLREDIFEIIDYAGRKLKKILLFTNAMLINRETAIKIKNSRIAAVIATLHSYDGHIHDSITRESFSWDRAIAGMQNLIEAGVPTYSFTVLLPHNAGHLAGIERFVKGMGAKTMYFPYIKQCPQDSLCMVNKKEFQEAISWAFHKSREYQNKLLSILNKRPKACSAFVSTISIKSDGNVTPCPFLDLSLGNIKNEKFYSILNRASRNKDLLGFLSVPAECGKCSLVEMCGGGCKAFRYNHYRDFVSRDENCSGPFEEKIPLERIGDFLPYVF